MAEIPVGDKYVAMQTTRNSVNGVGPQDDIRIGFVDPHYISIHVIKQGGSKTALAVPRALFGVNFEPDRFHMALPNRGYAMLSRATVLYR